MHLCAYDTLICVCTCTSAIFSPDSSNISDVDISRLPISLYFSYCQEIVSNQNEFSVNDRGDSPMKSSLTRAWLALLSNFTSARAQHSSTGIFKFSNQLPRAHANAQFLWLSLRAVSAQRAHLYIYHLPFGKIIERRLCEVYTCFVSLTRERFSNTFITRYRRIWATTRVTENRDPGNSCECCVWNPHVGYPRRRIQVEYIPRNFFLSRQDLGFAAANLKLLCVESYPSSVVSKERYRDTWGTCFEKNIFASSDQKYCTKVKIQNVCNCK